MGNSLKLGNYYEQNRTKINYQVKVRILNLVRTKGTTHVEDNMTILVVCFVLTGFMFCR